MRILDQYILKQVGGIFLFGVALFTTFLTVNDLFFLARLALAENVPSGSLLRLLMLRVPYAVSFSLPMATLLGTLLAFGRLSDRHEVVAMRTSGISLIRVAVPVVLGGVAVAAVTIGLNEWVVPISQERHRIEFARAVGASPTESEDVLFQERQETLVSVVYARRAVAGGEELEGIAVNQFERGRLARVIEAARARYGQAGWDFFDGTLYVLTGPTTVETRFQRLRVKITRKPAEIFLQQKDPSEMTIRELRAFIGVLRRAGQSIVRYAVWLHSRVAFPASSIIFALLAVPLGLRPHRSGHAIGLGLTIVVLLVYYLLMNTTLALGQSGRLPAVLAAWTPNILVGLFAGYLLWRAR